MTTTWFQKITLGASGLSALVIGATITIAPHTFYAAYGIELGVDPNLLSELRAPGANLAALGAIVLAGAFRPAMAQLSLILGAVVFLAYAFGRIIGVALDGMPSSGLVEATVIEGVIGGLCLVALWRRSRSDVKVPPVSMPG